jgi:hypothetical protein
MKRKAKSARTKSARTKSARARVGAKKGVTHKLRPATAAAPQPPPYPPSQAGEGWEGALVAASAQALGLTLDPAWQAGIKFNLQLILSHAAAVDEFPLPDDAEPAPIFHA